MNEKELAQFVKWLPSNINEFKDKTPEEVVTILNKLSRTEEGMSTISEFINKFKQNNTGMFKKGGKLDYMVEKLKNRNTVKFQNGGKTNSSITDDYIQREGTIGSDDRSWFRKQFDRLQTKYRSSDWANSAPAEVLAATTPYGFIHYALGNKDAPGDLRTATLSILPIGAKIGEAGVVVRNASKTAPLIFEEIKGAKNTPISNGRIITSIKAKQPFTPEDAQRLYDSDISIRELLDKGYNVSKDGRIYTASRKLYTEPEYIKEVDWEVGKHRRMDAHRNFAEQQAINKERWENASALERQEMQISWDAARTSGNKARRATSVADFLSKHH